ncbi:OLC1v1029998C1 [Oldenlandia corymbosa var. corymbosa]|uniref:OLC1v1029998C1 n=1 Tax=Oldenlandia corymbosa var. corymbosa TaxID=529605 RepID=A0AAV1CFT9_OLDCO|nr:OLC1v1029998C1 [Oldenlandia corymbosa var. corymbosa]
MASMQCHKPVEQSHSYTESVVITERRTTQAHVKTNNEHSFTNKVKEWFADHHLGQTNNHHGQATQHQAHAHANGHANGHVQQQQSICAGSHTGTANAAKKKDGQGHGVNFLSNIGGQMKNMTKRRHKRAGRGNKDDSGSSSSSSSSDDESDKETCGKNKK